MSALLVWRLNLSLSCLLSLAVSRSALWCLRRVESAPSGLRLACGSSRSWPKFCEPAKLQTQHCITHTSCRSLILLFSARSVLFASSISLSSPSDRSPRCFRTPMVLARVADFFTPAPTRSSFVDDGGRRSSYAMDPVEEYVPIGSTAAVEEEVDHEAARPPYIHAMLAGGIGGTTGDMLMHSLDTVKTRQQGDPHMPPKYTSMGNTYYTIFRQEGIRRGLYGGVKPAFLGSFSGTVTFFGTYEWSKRWMIDAGIPPSISYFTAGLIADLAAAPVYVPSEVLKTRLQLQGRYNNPHFNSGYNYRGTIDAARTIARTEGFGALFYGYKATLWRDLPFSALQFAFYEEERGWAKKYMGSNNIGLPLEIATAATAGGMAGVMTCPLDVVKTRIQTQHHDAPSPSGSTKLPHAHSSPSSQALKHSSHKPGKPPPPQSRLISTSSPSTALRNHSAATLDTSSVITGLRIIYKTEGIAGWFRGVGPRFVWTSVQSGTMLVLYQTLLRWFEQHPLVKTGENYV
ncbi:mitochondrial carrier domain-containing protein [Lophiotrema nucula]|uniref:Mitochondrial carrier domain-containing protein n=1 Tax=Lophiotrema nucula TaxID=690887 RepID=A0A6A5YRZ1_9PLEO|nr:mitochondrial carrier domain-containing protein [Lophiotrema nucula]